MASHRVTAFTKSLPRLVPAAAARVATGVRVVMARVWQRMLFRRPIGTEARVLVFRLGSIGDHLAARPALETIARRHTGAKLLLVTNAGPAQSWPAQLGLAIEVATYPSVDDLKRIVRDFAPDAVYYLPPYPLSLLRALRDALFFRACGVRRAVGFGRPDPTGWRARAMRPWVQAPAEWRRVALACGLEAAPVPMIAPGGGPEVAPGSIALIPAGKSATQHWPIEHFRDLAKLLRAQGHPLVWLGGPEDSVRVEQAGATEDRKLAGKLTLAETMAALARCRAVVSNDTGLAHAAAALGVPLVVVSSARAAKGAWEPAGMADRVRVLRTDMACEACELRECASLLCLKSIEPAAVLSALRDMGVTPG